MRRSGSLGASDNKSQPCMCDTFALLLHTHPLFSKCASRWMSLELKHPDIG